MHQSFVVDRPGNRSHEKRSIRIQGHATSVRLEIEFWAVLEKFAEVQNVPMSKLLSAIYAEAVEVNGEVSNFASLLRCGCVDFLKSELDSPLSKMPALDDRAGI